MSEEHLQKSLSPGGSPRQDINTSLFGKWELVAFICIATILVVFVVYSSIYYSSSSTGIISPSNCSQKVIQYINQNLVQSGSAASLVGIGESRGLYTMEIQYQSQNRTIYTTTDCNLLFTNYFDMTKPSEGTTASTHSANQQQAVNRSVRPVVDLYVMAFCPYGTQAETVIRPVFDLLGSNADFSIHYITTINGSTPVSVQSLHGPAEAQEDLRQACINKLYPSKYWEYIQLFDQQCYPSWQNATTLDVCRQNATTNLGIDLDSIATCANTTAGIALLKTDETAADAAGISGSPTLLINGVEYTGERTPEAYKEVICNSFETAPPSCNTTLSRISSSNTASGCT